MDRMKLKTIKEMYVKTGDLLATAEEDANGMTSALTDRIQNTLGIKLTDEVKRDITMTLFEAIHVGISGALTFAIDVREELEEKLITKKEVH